MGITLAPGELRELNVAMQPVPTDFHTIHLRDYNEIQTNSIYYTGLDGPVEDRTANIQDLLIVYWWNWDTSEWHMYWPSQGQDTIGTMKQGNIYQIVTYKTQDWQVPGPFYIPSTIPWPVFANPEYDFFYPHNACYVDLQAQEHTMPAGMQISQGDLVFRKGAGATNTLRYMIPGGWYGGRAHIDTTWHIPQDPNYVPPPGEPAFMGHLYMVDIPRTGDNADFVVRCPITNIGATPITFKATLHALLHDVFIDPVHRRETYEFTIEPGETVRLRYYSNWRGGARGDFWVEGDWGEQTPVMTVSFGYYYQGQDAEVRATTVKATDAVVRYSQRSQCTYWRYSVYTPPSSPYEQYIRHSMDVSDDAVSSSWTAIHCIFWPLLSGRLYRAYVYGASPGAAHRDGWTDFTTP